MQNRLTRVFGILWAHIVIAGIQDVLIHQRRTRRDLPKERDFDGFPNLDPLALLHEDLTGILAPILTIERRNSILLRMVAFLERLERCH